MKEYDDRQVDWTRREHEKEDAERKRAIKLGEGRGKVTGDIKKTDDVRVRIDNVETLKFRPPVDLKKGDAIKVTIEKV